MQRISVNSLTQFWSNSRLLYFWGAVEGSRNFLLLLFVLGDRTEVVSLWRPFDIVINLSSTISPSSLFMVMMVGTEPRELTESFLCGILSEFFLFDFEHNNRPLHFIRINSNQKEIIKLTASSSRSLAGK